MYRHVQDFLNDWKDEESYTVKMFSGVTEDTKSQKINENVRTLERLAWHITHTITEMGTAAGLFESDALADTPTPQTMVEIIEIYQKYNIVFAQTVRSKWTDSSLDEEVPMYGETWAKGKVLSVIIGHEAHHRSQMTIVMRMAGLLVPGIYGPAKEEWVAMGVPAMD